jgi:hypothetical protein
MLKKKFLVVFPFGWGGRVADYLPLMPRWSALSVFFAAVPDIVAAQAEECSFQFVSPGMRLSCVLSSSSHPSSHTPCLPRSHGDSRTCRDIYDCSATGSCSLVRTESLSCSSFTLPGRLSSSGSASVAVGDPASKIGDPDPERSH